MILETDRLILRPVVPADADDIFEYSRSENVGPSAGWKPHESKEETIEIMKMIFLDKENIFGIITKETKKLIGTAGLMNDPKRENGNVKMLGYAIGEPYWGYGYMTEAAKEIIRYGFENLKQDLISAYCYPFNNRSKRVIEKCGFEYEGRLKLAEKLYNDKVYDNECYALSSLNWSFSEQ